MLYTRKGDDGFAILLKTSKRLKKNNPLMHALGELDELNSLLGIIKVKARGKKIILGIPFFDLLQNVQENLFMIQAEIAGANKKIAAAKIKELEIVIDRIENKILPQKKFIIPGGTEIGAMLDYARAVARRTERTLADIKISQPISGYLNRLSSLLFALARLTNAENNKQENTPRYT